MDDELSDRRVERAVLERQLLGSRLPDVDAGMTRERSGDEALRWIDGRDPVRPEPPNELSGERSRAAADVEHAPARADAGKVGELRREERRVPAHEPVVGVCAHGEAHAVQSTRSFQRGVIGTVDPPSAVRSRVGMLS